MKSKIENGISNIINSVVNWFKELPRENMELPCANSSKCCKVDF